MPSAGRTCAGEDAATAAIAAGRSARCAAAAPGSAALNVLVPRGAGGRPPVAEARLEQRPSCGERQVADHEDRRIVGPDPGAGGSATSSSRVSVRTHGEVAGAGERPPVGMGRRRRAGPAARGWRRPAGWVSSAAMPASCCWRRRSTSAGREGRIADDVGEQVERRRRESGSARSASTVVRSSWRRCRWWRRAAPAPRRAGSS